MFIYFTSLVALVGVNLWHLILLLTNKTQPRPDTISEHAYRSSKWLRAHRIAHCVFSASLIVYAMAKLVPEKQYVLAGLLVTGAIMDVIEVITLKKEDDPHPISLNVHVVSAWLMAFCYLGYGVLIAKYAGLSGYIVNIVWILFVANVALATKYRFKKFWISQMFYFMVLVTVIAFAQYRII